MITQKQIKSWIPTAEYIFVKHMPFGVRKSGDSADSDHNENSSRNIDLSSSLKSLPPVYIGSPKKFLKLRTELVNMTQSHQVICKNPYDSIMEMIHGDAGDAILIQQKLLPEGEHADIIFCHYFWHELGHYFAIQNECPGNDLARFFKPSLSEEPTKQEGYWLWSEFIAESISNYVDEQHCKIDNAEFYHPELITWEPDQWISLSYRLSDMLNMAFSLQDFRLDEASLAMYFATLLTDDATKRYLQAAENAELKVYNWKTEKLEAIAPENIDPTCISGLPKPYQKFLLNMKSLLKRQLKKEKFWEIDEGFLKEIGNCIMQMMNIKLHLNATELKDTPPENTALKDLF